MKIKRAVYWVDGLSDDQHTNNMGIDIGVPSIQYMAAALTVLHVLLSRQGTFAASKHGHMRHQLSNRISHLSDVTESTEASRCKALAYFPDHKRTSLAAASKQLCPALCGEMICGEELVTA